MVDDMRLFVAVKQGSRKMRDSMLVIVAPKAKVTARNLMSTAHRKEEISKYKVDYAATLAPHDLPTNTEYIEDLENFWYNH